MQCPSTSITEQKVGGGYCGELLSRFRVTDVTHCLAQQEASPVSVFLTLCGESSTCSLRYMSLYSNDNLSALKDLAFRCHGRPSQKAPRNSLVFPITIISSLDIDAATEMPTEYVLLRLKKHRFFEGFFNRSLQKSWGKIRVLLIQCWLSPPASPLSLLLLLFALFFTLCVLLGPLLGTSLGS
jgi:hypothetical protein